MRVSRIISFTKGHDENFPGEHHPEHCTNRIIQQWLFISIWWGNWVYINHHDLASPMRTSWVAGKKGWELFANSSYSKMERLKHRYAHLNTGIIPYDPNLVKTKWNCFVQFPYLRKQTGRIQKKVTVVISRVEGLYYSIIFLLLFFYTLQISIRKFLYNQYKVTF